MGRKRSPEHDYICRLCQCPCDSHGGRHLGGGDADHTACGKPADPVLRSEWDAMMAADLAAVKAVIGRLPWRSSE